MRRLIIAAFVIAPSIAAAQATPLHTGGWIISGSAGLSHSQTDDGGQSGTSISIAPSGLYFVSPRLAVGGSVLLGYQSVISSWSYGIGPEARYFFADSTAKLLPFIRASVVPEWAQLELAANGGPSTTTVRTITATAAAGLTQIVASHVGITGEAYFQREMYDSGTDEVQPNFDISSYGLRFGLTIFVH